MTTFDTETDRYLERPALALECRLERRGRARESSPPPLASTRAPRSAGVQWTVAAVALAAVGLSVGPGARRSSRRREAAVLAPVQAAPGTIEHILVQYRMDSGETFIEYELDRGRRRVLSSDGGGYARPGAEHAVDVCRLSDDVVELYLPSENQILRAQVGAEVKEDSARQDSESRPRARGRCTTGCASFRTGASTPTS